MSFLRLSRSSWWGLGATKIAYRAADASNGDDWLWSAIKNSGLAAHELLQICIGNRMPGKQQTSFFVWFWVLWFCSPGVSGVRPRGGHLHRRAQPPLLHHPGGAEEQLQGDRGARPPYTAGREAASRQGTIGLATCSCCRSCCCKTHETWCQVSGSRPG